MSEVDAELDAYLRGLHYASAPVTVSRSVSGAVQRLTLNVASHPAAESYRGPGQYVAIAPNPVPGETPPRFFAIASVPSALPEMELLVGRGSETSDALADARPGDEVYLTKAMGDGYPVQRFETRPLVIFATGTGIAAVRPVIAQLVDGGRDPSALFLYYGEGREEDLAFTDDLAAWSAAGVHVTTLRGAGPRPEYVQDAFIADPDAPEPTLAEFVVCGSDVMQAAAVATLESLGVAQRNIHFNY